jgi:hypothetical protein
MMLEAAAFVLGLTGSGHCLAMCGPLVVCAPTRRLASQAAYHGGRVGLYIALGAAAGVTGAAVTAPGWRDALAVLAGVLLVCAALGHAGRFFTSGVPAWLSRPITRVIGLMAVWARQHGVGGPFVLGLLNALLPCGWLYGALAAAAGLGGPVAGARFMTAFGLGTVPALVALRWLPSKTVPSNVLRLAAPWASLAVGVLLIARGLSTHSLHHALSPRSEARVEHGLTATSPDHGDVQPRSSHAHD